MTRSRIFGFLVKRWLYVVVVLAGMIYGYIERHALRQPDPASGHVLRVMAPRHRKTPRHVMYLTSSERTLYYGCLIAMGAGVVGIVGQLFIQKNRRFHALTRQPSPASPPE